jgi:predicted RNase H-like HicB family nuclease
VERGQGKTEKQAMKNIQEAVKLHIQTMAEDGIPLKPDQNIKEVLLSVAV